MAEEIYEIHIPEQRYNKIGVFLIKRKTKRPGKPLEYVWEKIKKPVNGQTVQEVMRNIGNIIKDDSDNLKGKE